MKTEKKLTIQKDMVLLIVSILILLPSLLFIFIVNEPKFDEKYHLKDILRYATEGINIQTINAQTNPTGPGTHLWASIWAYIFEPSIHLIRFSIWICWVLIIYFYKLLIDQKTITKDLFVFSALFLFVNPYTATLSGLIMTEPFAILCVIIGLYLLNKLEREFRFYFFVLLGFSLGIAVISRLYYLSLLPSTYVVLYFLYNSRYKNAYFLVYSILTLGIMLLPLLFIYMLWGGITPPTYSKGLVFENQRLHIGINIWRPVSVMMYIGIYTAPFVLFFYPIGFYENLKKYIVAFVFAIFVFYNVYIWGLDDVYNKTGLIDAIIRFVKNKNVVFGNFSYFVSLFISSLSLIFFIGNIKNVFFEGIDLIKIFSLSVVFFFILQQVFVSGHNPFYDRYLIQIAPFVGILLYSQRIKFNYKLNIILGVYLLISQAALWRWIFIK